MGRLVYGLKLVSLPLSSVVHAVRPLASLILAVRSLALPIIFGLPLAFFIIVGQTLPSLNLVGRPFQYGLRLVFLSLVLAVRPLSVILAVWSLASLILGVAPAALDCHGPAPAVPQPVGRLVDYGLRLVSLPLSSLVLAVRLLASVILAVRPLTPVINAVRSLAS